MHRRWQLGALLAALVLAGCSGGPPGSSADPTATPTATAPLTSTTPADATAENTVAYRDLSTDAQRAFDAARNGTVVLGPDSPYVDADFDWSLRERFYVAPNELRYVRRDGTYYETSLSAGSGVAMYDIQAKRADDTSGDEVIAYESLPARVSDEVRWAIENGSYQTPWGQWASLPESLDPGESVRYEGTVYRMTYGVGDARLFELRVRAA